MVTIRQVRESSAAELSELCTTSFVDAYRGVNSDVNLSTYCEKNYSKAVIEANLINPKLFYKVAYRDNKAIGFFMLHHQKCPIVLDENSIELKQIYVLAREYGTGLGKRLLDEVVRCAHQHNRNCIWLSVSDLNVRAISFYTKHGFEPIGAAATLEVGDDRLLATVMVLKTSLYR